MTWDVFYTIPNGQVWDLRMLNDTHLSFSPPQKIPHQLLWDFFKW